MRRATSRWRSLPDFVIIGGQRCGTTSLFAALSQHRSIIPSFRKEVHFFDLHHQRGTAWYRANFPFEWQLNDRATFEATPNYLAYPGAPDRLHGVLPDAKLIVLLRDPVERTYSSWKLRVKEGAESRSFDTAVLDGLQGESDSLAERAGVEGEALGEAMRFAYLEKSQYAHHLERWLERFDRDRVLILQSEQIFEEPDQGRIKIEDFLEIAPDPSMELPRVNATDSSEIPAESERLLRDYFASRNERLEKLTGRTFDWS